MVKVERGVELLMSLVGKVAVSAGPGVWLGLGRLVET